MKILVTGSNGFIGKNLIQHLQEIPKIEIITFDKEDSFTLIEKKINEIDFIYHLAGINRPKETKEFYDGNSELSKRLVDLLVYNKKKIPIVFTSSIQADKDNDYGKSKKIAENYLSSYPYSHIYRLHNVFGKWCQPNYNSVVATFCHNIANDLEIKINDEDHEMELIYIDDIIDHFINLLNDKNENKQSIKYIEPVYKIKLGELARIIKDFKKNLKGLTVPQTGDEFIKKLFSTYISYVDPDNLIFNPVSHVDNRGSFAEIIHTIDSGQISVSTSKPGIIRGNHYHHTKIEKFIVISGRAKIKYKHLITDETREYIVDSNNLQIVTIPVGYTHNIENIGEEEMILLIWCNEIFDKERPDTFFKEV